jgi:uncharacterized protein YdeI (YjbR/CyaY-like superfamily)
MPTRRAASAPPTLDAAPTLDAPLRLDGPADFDAWLTRHHASSDGAWLQLAKAGTPGLRYAEALDVALCHGWIDGQKKSLDAHHFLQRFTPRRARSLWSRINRDKALALIAAGRMRPAGQAQVDAAKADGRWDEAYAGARSATVPPELQAALDAQPAARAFFQALDGTNRYAVLWRVQTARTPGTRARRIEQLVAMLARGEKIHG